MNLKRCSYAVFFSLLSLALLALNTAKTSPKTDPRTWKDMQMAIGYYLYGQFPVFSTEWKKPIREGLSKESVKNRFWKTISSTPFLNGSVGFLDYFHDVGRAYVLGWGFKLLKGISPYLLFWLGFILAIPVFFWLGYEFCGAEERVSGAIFLFLLGISSFFSEALTLSYSTAGFYIIGVLILTAFSLSSISGSAVSPQGLLARLALGGTLFGVCLLCRSGTVFILPGFVIAIWLWVSKKGLNLPKGWKKVLFFVFALVVFLSPYIVLKASVDRVVSRTLALYGKSVFLPLHHPVWHALWCGLGDFDRSKDHFWDDRAAERAVELAGGPKMRRVTGPGNVTVTREYEKAIRALFFRDVLTDPSWYFTILGKRLGSTVLQTKTLFWSFHDRHLKPLSKAPRERSNDIIDRYYRRVAQVDTFALGSYRVELSLLPFILATFIFLGQSARVSFRVFKASHRVMVHRQVWVLLSMASGTLFLPVLVTTAGGLETQGFAFLYFLGFSFFVQHQFFSGAGNRGAYSGEVDTIIDPLKKKSAPDAAG